MNWKPLIDQVITSLSAVERETCIAYIESRVIPARKQFSGPGINVTFDLPVVMAFVDLEPELNWAHQGRYIFMTESGEIVQIVDADSPPFLRQVSDYLRVVHIGSKAPAWACVAEPIS